MSNSTSTYVSPVGASVSSHLKKKLQDPELRAEYERLAAFEEIARIVIRQRADRQWTQQELADRMRTTASAVSRLEAGQHETTPATMRKLASAFGGRALTGFDFGTAEEPQRVLVAL